jgi:hypothetical protein
MAQKKNLIKETYNLGNYSLINKLFDPSSFLEISSLVKDGTICNTGSSLDNSTVLRTHYY